MCTDVTINPWSLRIISQIIPYAIQVDMDYPDIESPQDMDYPDSTRLTSVIKISKIQYPAITKMLLPKIAIIF